MVGSLELGGLSESDAEAALSERARRIAEEPIELYTGEERIELKPEEVSFLPDVDATLERAMQVGRNGNLLARTWGRLRSYVGTTRLEWKATIDREAAQAFIDDWSERFEDGATEGAIRAQGTRITPVEPEAGRTLDRDATGRVLQAALRTYPRRSMELPFEVVGNRTSAEDAQRAAEVATELIRAPITLTAPGGTLELTPEGLAGMLEAVPVERRDGWTLAVRFSPDRISEQLSEQMTPFEREPRSATFSVSGNSVSINPSEHGLAFDPAETAENLDEAARRDAPREAEIAFASVEPSRTTEEARALNINEQVSSFTTNFVCCPPRVTNIHRMSDMVDGAVVPPGGTFSLNQHVGPRTEEKGYVSAPMIYDGEYKDSVGGGVSQYATTFFNTVFFGGYRLEAFQAHSYYISRYPAGREATISWPHPDLRFTNNSSAGVLIKSWYTNNSITVAFYGDKEGKSVTSESGDRTNFTDPPRRREVNRSLPPGGERVVQGGSQGFDIVVWRIVERSDGESTRERFFTRYKPEPRIIEHNPATPAPTPEPTPEPKDEEEESPTPEPTPPPENNGDEGEDP